MRPFALPTRTLLAASAFLASCSAQKLEQPLFVASAFTSQQICSETFVSGFAPETIFAERVEPTEGIHLVSPYLHYQVDRDKKEVTTMIAGGFASRSVYRAPFGCALDHGAPDERGQFKETSSARADGASSAIDTGAIPEIAGSEVVAPINARLAAALDHGFAERDKPPYIYTKAIVVIHDGRIVAERYAPGVGVDTELLGFSATKSITNALVGILVGEGKINVLDPAPIPAWQDAGDPRSKITTDQLLRQSAGLDLLQTNSGFDASSRISFVEADPAQAAARAKSIFPPGTHWAYSDGNFILLSRIVRDTVRKDGSDVYAFAERNLFVPTGMTHTTLEFDATGTPLGASYLLASARDWARFGLLYLNDGMVGSRRILPEGWVKYSSTRTLDTGYGAGFWVNKGDGNAPWGLPWGMPHVPKDTFFAMGYMGQHVVIVPSEHLVVVRLGVSHHRDGLIQGADRLVSEVIAALH